MWQSCGTTKLLFCNKYGSFLLFFWTHFYGHPKCINKIVNKKKWFTYLYFFFIYGFLFLFFIFLIFYKLGTKNHITKEE